MINHNFYCYYINVIISDFIILYQENDKWFAKNIVSEVLKRLKTEPDKAKEVIRDLLKDRSIYGDSPLHCALRYEQKDIIKYILMLMGVIPDSKHLVNIQNSSGKVGSFQMLYLV